MKVFYFVHITGTDSGISGVPRVVKNLGRELLSRGDVELIPVAWSQRHKGLVYAEQKQLENLARHGGPQIKETGQARKPIAAQPGDWLLFAEAPHLQSHNPDYPSLSISEPIGFARSCGLQVAVVFHDILPLIYHFDGRHSAVFADMLPRAGQSDGRELQRLRFADYAHALALADIVFPVSRTTGSQLFDWLIQHGHRTELLPPMPPMLLPEEVFGVERVVPQGELRAEARAAEFLAVGTVCTHKNQLGAMLAFQRLTQRRPDLDLRLHIVGSIAPGSAVPASLMAKRAEGRIILHGAVSDERLEALIKKTRASVFVSLAEGYGLPVAESLWHGKPCLCSGDGSIAEIGQGGGCLEVNPRSLEQMEAGFETLATDPLRYSELLQQIATRKMKSWNEYASDIARELAAYSHGGRRQALESLIAPPEPSFSFDESGAAALRHDLRPGEGSRHGILMVSPSDLSVHDAYAARERPIRYKSAIRYDHAEDAAVQQEVLFYGPYAALSAGRYAFIFDGELDGELDLSFTADAGARKIAHCRVSSFAEPVPVELVEAVNKFEIVASRTPSLRRLVLRSAFAEFRGFARRADEDQPAVSATHREASAPQEPAAQDSEAAAPAQPSATYPEASRPARGLVLARDDDGNALSLPFALAADKMRVHEAYGAGSQNRLRVGSTISFAAKKDSDVEENVLFFGPYLHLESGDYSFRFSGALEGSLRLRFTRDFGEKCLRELVVTSFDAPVQVRVDETAEKFEIIGERMRNTRAMTLQSIELASQPLTSARKPPFGVEPKASQGLLDRAASFFRLRPGAASPRGPAAMGGSGGE